MSAPSANDKKKTDTSTNNTSTSASSSSAVESSSSSSSSKAPAKASAASGSLSSATDNKKDEQQPVAADGVKPADIKVILLGDSAVGKSKLVERFLMNEYVPRQLSTYALTVFRHRATINSKAVEVDFWDTAGQERFASIHPSYYHRADACILVFDVTRKVTYTNLTQWYKELQQYRMGIPVFVVANKIDVDYNVTQKNFQFAKKRELPFFFCSAADGTNVVKVFREVLEAAVDYKAKPPADFVEDVYRTIDYFDTKDKTKTTEPSKTEEAQKKAEAPNGSTK